MGQKPRQYSEGFRTEAVSLVREQGLSIHKAAHEIGISEWTLRSWVRKAEPRSSEVGEEMSKDEELRQLREEVRQLRMEREILKKATAFFAKEKP